MERDVVSRSLEALASQMAVLRKEEFSARFKALPRFSEEADPDLRLHDDLRRRVHEARESVFRSARERLEVVEQALTQDGAAWEAERAAHDRVVERLVSAVPRPASDAVEPPLTLPLLSSTIESYLARKREDDVGERHVEGLTRRFQAFIEHVGDKPIDRYRASDLQSFVSTLARVPATWSKDERVRALSARAAAEWNTSRRQPLPCMSETTITLGYARPIRTLFGWLAVEHGFTSPFQGMRLTVPKTAKGSVRRKPLTVEELNTWFAQAAREKRADDRFLPLLGYLTGARIAELSFLQGRDLRQIGDAWALGLSEPLIVDGREVRRPLKNSNSGRLVALHETLVKAGFVDWMKSRADTDWVFPHLHQSSIVRPSDTASKRMARAMKKAGVHEALVKVFHSLRHNARDWMERGAGLSESIVRRQMGHAAEDTAQTYGDDLLTSAEVQTIARAPLPEGLDLRPYLRRRR
ncbi:tyrosine-type recombinase/integrase [Microvirga sp. 2MCAF35]|uniref:tyrosine-type recombinase/integrase n=1 Tax=Microvirga sp. 2MCAF35 TaxID=3232987 RepID=UPI003F947932